MIQHRTIKRKLYGFIIVVLFDLESKIGQEGQKTEI